MFGELVPREKSKAPFISIEEALEEIRRGRMIVLMDDEQRENEGDLCMAAELATGEAKPWIEISRPASLALVPRCLRCTIWSR